MLTYQLQNRILKCSRDNKLEFPGQLELEVKLGPPEAFGTSDKQSRLVLFEREAQLLFNANTGHMYFRSKPALEPLDVKIEAPGQTIILNGDTLWYQEKCPDYETLNGILSTFQFMLTPLLNMGFADPPIILYIKGKLGKASFCWEHEKSQATFVTRTPEQIERHTVDSFKHLALMSGTTNRRLAAGLHYFYIASRLLVSGNSPWEFMAECVLNMTKALEIMFGGRRDSVREKLLELGYSTEEVESEFIPLMILRNQFDVEHPRISILKRDQLQILYRYLSVSEERFRKLFIRIFERLDEGRFEFDQKNDLRLDVDEQKTLDRLIDSIKTQQIS